MDGATLEASPVCANCGALVAGDYCARCGQRNAPLRQPLRAFFGEAFTEYVGVDGRLWRSIGLLLLHPGALTRAYLEGRRVAYLRPFRLYLTATLLFFFLLSVLDPVAQLERVLADDRLADTTAVVGERQAALDADLAASLAGEEEAVRRVDSLRAVVADADTLSDAARDTQEALEAAEDDLADYRGEGAQRERQRLRWQRDLLATWPPDSVFNPSDLRAAAELLFPDPVRGGFVGLPGWLPEGGTARRLEAARTDREGLSAASDLLRAALGQLPTVMFLLLPVFALLLKLIYVRREWYYSEHLVFGLHTHAFAFLVFAAVAALLGFGRGATWAQTVATVLVVLIPVYFYVAQKRVYGQGWVKTALKALVLGWVYGWLLLLLGLTLALVLAALWG